MISATVFIILYLVNSPSPGIRAATFKTLGVSTSILQAVIINATIVQVVMKIVDHSHGYTTDYVLDDYIGMALTFVAHVCCVGFANHIIIWYSLGESSGESGRIGFVFNVQLWAHLMAFSGISFIDRVRTQSFFAKGQWHGAAVFPLCFAFCTVMLTAASLTRDQLCKRGFLPDKQAEQMIHDTNVRARSSTGHISVGKRASYLPTA